MKTLRQRSFQQHHARCWMVTWTISILLLLSTSTIATSYSTDEFLPSSSSSSLGIEGSWETCATHSSCTDCYQSSNSCHWCAHDNACHVKGSMHTGCVSGASCSDIPPEEAQSCTNHTSCKDCSSSSWGCHWCKSDEACHAVGSLHGCAAGTDCYAINRCQRLEPERMEGGGTFTRATFVGVGPVAKGVLGVIMGLVLCCSTMCFAGVTFLKCAVDDLVGEPVEIVEDGMVIGGAEYYEEVEGGQQTAEVEEGQDELEIPLMQNDALGEQDAEEGSEKETEDSAPEPMRSGAASVAQLSRVSLSSNRPAPKPSSIKGMYFGCQLCYLFTMQLAILSFIVGMSYAPRHPQYNVCTNELAWKSIVEGMASLKMSASFDLLISVYNPNRFEVDLSNGHGQLHHDGEYVGSFDIPEGRVSGQAISDIVVKVDFTPDKWSALSLTSEYYEGKLEFLIGGHAHVRIPGLGNYQFDAKFDDIHVNVNDPSMDDTHLCACPGWKKP